MELPWFPGSSTASTGPTIRNRFSYLPDHFITQPNVSTTIPGGGRLGVVASSFDISQKFEELEVTSKEEQNEKKQTPMTNKVTSSDDASVEATGLDIPPPATSFSEMGFSAKALNDNIRRCKYMNPTTIQRYAIPVAMAGRDLMACAQTGSGKTAAFCFPIINGIVVDKQPNKRVWGNSGGTVPAFPVALILAPTRELTCQIHEEAKKFSYQTGVKVAVTYGGAPIAQQLWNLERGVDILVATPGRLLDIIERGKVSLRRIKYLALDEADRMLDMGFEHQVRKIVQQMGMPAPGARQTMLFSATFPAKIQKLALDFLYNYIFLSAGKVGSSTDLIVQKVEFVPDIDKRDYLVNLLHSQETNKNALTLVFVETKRGADALERWLSRKGFPSAAIHGDKIQLERERALKSFRSGRIRILVATDVAARGLDIPDVGHVINYDLPRGVDDYVHRIGRTGRAGKSGLATAFFSDKNVPLAKPLVELMLEANQHVPTWLTQYADNGSAHAHPHEASSDPIAPVDFAYVADYSNRVAYSSDLASYDYGYNYASVTATGWD